MRRAIVEYGSSDNRISGYVGHGRLRNPDGVIISTSCPKRRSHVAVCASVATTPLIWGCQASVTMMIRIGGEHRMRR